MSIFSIIKKEFEFLTRLYDFKICSGQKHGAYYYVEWTNLIVNIKVLYDLRVTNPITIFIYDARSLGTIYDVTEYKNEFAINSRSHREKIRYASEWLRNAILGKIIAIY